MAAAIVVVCVSVALGTALALIPGLLGRTIGPVRTFALLAAFGVVGFHLVPHALEGAGIGALGALVAGLIAPPALQRAVTWLYLRARRESALCIGLEAGYLGLLAHRIGDGVALGAAASRGPGLLVAIAAHTVPVAAVVVLAFAAEYGVGAALTRAAGLVVASLVGVFAVGLLDGTWLQVATPWVDAAVAGLLLHFVAHGLTEDLPGSPLQRVGDLVAGLVGLLVSVVPGMVHGGGELGHEHGGHTEVLERLTELAIVLAPGFVVGVLLATALAARRGGRPVASLATGGLGAGLAQAVFDPVAGWLTAAGRLPAPTSHANATIPLATRVSFWVASPGFGIELLALTVVAFGPRFAVVRVALLAVVALAAALPVALTTGGASASGEAPSPSAVHLAGTQSGWLAAIELAMGRIGPWLVVGNLAGAYLASLVPPTVWGAWLGSGAGMGWMAPVCLLGTVPAVAAVPPLLLVAGHGVDPSTLLVVLLLLPVPWGALARRVGRERGPGVAALSLVVAISAALFGAIAVAPWLTVGAMPTPVPVAAGIWLFLGGLLLAAGAWRPGVRGWIAAVVSPHRHRHGFELKPHR